MSGRINSTARNFAVTLFYQLVTVAFGLIIPRLFLDSYGPDIHGLTSSISNLMVYVVLLNAGLAAASIQALYEPLAKNDTNRINAVLNAVNRSFMQTGFAYLAAVMVLSFVLPFITSQQVPGLLAFLLMLIMGSASTAECFLYSRFNVLLLADQKLYVLNVFNIIMLVIRGVLQFVLIKAGFSILIVQAVPAATILIQAAFLKIYIKKHYPALNRAVLPDNRALSKRWQALVHQAAGVVVNNTDAVLLTVFGNLVLVSIYSVYQMVFSNLYILMTMAFSQASIASFGQLLALKDKSSVLENYKKYEFLYDIFISIAYSVCAVMILPFVGLYTRGIANVPYVDGTIAALFMAIGIANNLRVPGLTLINAAGLYRETKWRAIAEAAINFAVSVSLVRPLGIAGVLIGTIASFAYRTVDIILYANRRILNVSPKRTIARACRVVVIVCLNIVILKLPGWAPGGWGEWALDTLITGLICVAVAFAVNAAFEYRSMVDLFRIFHSIVEAHSKKTADCQKGERT